MSIVSMANHSWPQDSLQAWRTNFHSAFGVSGLEFSELSSLRSSEIFSRQLGAVKVGTVVAGACRGRWRKATQERPLFYYTGVCRGTARVTTGSRSFDLSAGDGIVTDSRAGIEFELSDHHLLSLELPYSELANWNLEPARIVGVSTSSASCWTRVLHESIQLACDPRVTSADQAFTLSNQLLSTFLLSIRGLEFPSENRRADLAMKLKRALSEHYYKQSITAPKLARDYNISVRQLHECFAAIGSTYGVELMRARLAHAARMLSDRQFDSHSIMDVAFRCGFADASHLRRRFREQFKLTPSAFREKLSNSGWGVVKAN